MAPKYIVSLCPRKLILRMVISHSRGPEVRGDPSMVSIASGLCHDFSRIFGPHTMVSSMKLSVFLESSRVVSMGNE